uniref:hypothetical protein n=1 Tax=Serratia marcescens TaxID=615 RepID=UPI0025AAC8C6
MREERLFPCCDCREAFYAVKLSDSDAESYDENVDVSWIGPYISIHFLSLNPLLVRRRRYSR